MKNAMVGDSAEESDCRERYATELRRKRVQRSTNPHFGVDELADELHRIGCQEFVTPGRRGEQIKREEINNDIVRRMAIIEAQTNPKDRGL